MQRSCLRRGGWVTTGAIALAIGLSGCGSSGTTPENKTSTSAESVLSTATPPDAVKAFLQAIKVGDEKTADEMLTKIAREKTKEADLHVAPPGSDTANYKIGKHVVEGKEAKVSSTWTDMDEDGKPQTDEIVWLLKQEPEGWRICGMATELFPDEEPLILNFEDPAEMLERQKKAEEEMVRRATAEFQKNGKPGTKTASKPGDATSPK
jgi:hypothetical protein